MYGDFVAPHGFFQLLSSIFGHSGELLTVLVQKVLFHRVRIRVLFLASSTSFHLTLIPGLETSLLPALQVGLSYADFQRGTLRIHPAAFGIRPVASSPRSTCGWC